MLKLCNTSGIIKYMNSVIKQNRKSIILDYRNELYNYQKKFWDVFGYWPYRDNSEFFCTLTLEEQELSKAFYNNKYVSACDSLISLYEGLYEGE